MSFAVIIGLIVLNVVGRSNKIRPGDIQSLLILPFDNYTGNDQLDIVISGMHSALIIDIGRISDKSFVGSELESIIIFRCLYKTFLPKFNCIKRNKIEGIT